MSGKVFPLDVSSLSRNNVGRVSRDGCLGSCEEKTWALPTRASFFDGHFCLFNSVETGRWAARAATRTAESLMGIMGLMGGHLEEHWGQGGGAEEGPGATRGFSPSLCHRRRLKQEPQRQ